jgi:Flp pilus assembly protein TadB
MWWWGLVPSIGRGASKVSAALDRHEARQAARLAEKLSKMTLEEQRAFFKYLEQTERVRKRNTRRVVCLLFLAFCAFMVAPIVFLYCATQYYWQTELAGAAAAGLFFCYEIIRKRQKRRFTHITVTGWYWLICVVLVLAFVKGSQ